MSVFFSSWWWSKYIHTSICSLLSLNTVGQEVYNFTQDLPEIKAISGFLVCCSVCVEFLKSEGSEGGYTDKMTNSPSILVSLTTVNPAV